MMTSMKRKAAVVLTALTLMTIGSGAMASAKADSVATFSFVSDIISQQSAKLQNTISIDKIDKDVQEVERKPVTDKDISGMVISGIVNDIF